MDGSPDPIPASQPLLSRQTGMTLGLTLLLCGLLTSLFAFMREVDDGWSRRQETTQKESSAQMTALRDQMRTSMEKINLQVVAIQADATNIRNMLETSANTTELLRQKLEALSARLAAVESKIH